MGSKSLRVVYRNLAENAGLSAASVSTLPVSNLQNGYKGVMWRSPTTNVVITADFPKPSPVTMVALLYTNLSQSAEIRIQGYSGPIKDVLEFDTNWVLANPPDVFETLDWGVEELGMNHHNRFDPHKCYCVHWLESVYSVERLTIEIRDDLNPDGFVQASTLLIGDHWEPEITADLGVQLGYEDLSTQSRLDSGAVRNQSRPMYKSLQFQLSALSLDEGQKLNQIVRHLGLSRPVFVSLYPEHSDVNLERSHQLYGKLRRMNPFSTPFYNTNQISLSVEEI